MNISTIVRRRVNATQGATYVTFHPRSETRRMWAAGFAHTDAQYTELSGKAVTTRQPTHQVQDERELLPRPSMLEGTWTTRRRVVNGRSPAPGAPISTQGRYGRRGKAHKENLARHSKANVAYVPCAMQAPCRRHARATHAPCKHLAVT